MATAALYFAAHFNMPRPHAMESSIPSPCSNPPSIHSVPTKTETPTYNIFASAAQHHVRAKTGTTEAQSDSILFRLPAELRNQVYEELLCPDTPHASELGQYHDRGHKQQSVYPAILGTCRRINEEASDLLYTTHVFHAHPSLLTSLPHLISTAQPVINPTRVAKIKRWQLTLRLDTDPRFTAERAAAAFSGAEYFEIRVWQSMFDGCDDSVLRLFTGVRGVQVARVTGCADPALARWLEERMMMPIEKEMEGECTCEGEKEWVGGMGRDVWTFGGR